MSLLNRSDDDADDPALSSDYDTVRVDDDLVQTALTAPDANPDAILVRPHKDNGGIEAMDEVLTALHGVETERNGWLWPSIENVSPAHAFETRYAATDATNERALSLQYLDGTPGGDSVLQRQLETEYRDSLFDERPAHFLPLSEGDHLAGATLALRRYTLYPINNTALDGFGSDPTGSIMQEMVGAVDSGDADANVVVQVMFQPAQRSWLQGVANGTGVAENEIDGAPGVKDLTYDLRQETYEIHRPVPWEREKIPHQPSKKDKDVATMLEEQDGKAWGVFIRVFAASPDPDVARQRTANVAAMFRNFYEFRGEQSFVAQPLTQTDLPAVFEQGTRREWEDCGIVKTQREAAGLVNVPEEKDVATSKLRWSLTKPGDGVPPGTARFPASDHGVEGGSDEEEVAMLDNPEPGDPFWFGRGTKHGIEAGVYADLLDTHMFIAGRTGFGKTVFSNHFCSQFIERGDGGLIVDPKGDDADDFIREWPDDRDEEDLIVMDLGLSPEDEGYEKIPRFNFMEIPPGYDPDSRFAATMIEALADDITAMVAQSGGSQKYLGALMKRVTKTVARGLLKSGRGCSLLDLACACASADGISEFSRWMDEDRIAWIRETAKRFEEKEDTDLEPLAGRMDEWVHNDAIRDLISARDPSFSIHEAVEQGKVIVVRFAKGAGETERRLLTTALVRRTYASKRVCDNDDPYYLMCDEFDKVVTEESNLHSILSEARGHNYRCVLACQAPSNQLPEKTKNAVANQINTFLTFNPGAENAEYVAKHHTVDAETLRHMPLYKCYLKTHTQPDYDMTHSYLVDAFEPIREVRERVTGETGRSDDEVEALKLRSMERYGAEIESAEEQQASSAFYDAGAPVEPGEAGQSELDMSTEYCRNRALKAVYDQSIRGGGPGGSVAVGDCVDRLQRYLPGGEVITDAGKAWRKVLQKVPDSQRGHHEEDDTMYVRVLDKPFMNLGESENDGNAEHWAPMKDAYVPLTQLGFVADIPAQTGEAMPDALAKLDDALDLDGDLDPAEIADRVDDYRENEEVLERLAGTRDAYIEAEHTTGDSQPSQTIRNLAQAHNAGHRCLFVCRENVAERVYNTVERAPQGCRSDHPVEGEQRYYTGTNTLNIDGETITRPGASENVWVHEDETGQYVLRDTDGTEHTRFNSPAEVFTDAEAYPDGGERNVKPPMIPEYECGGDDLANVEYDIIVVPVPETDKEDNEQLLTPLDLALYRDDGPNIPLTEIVAESPSEGGSASRAATGSEAATVADGGSDAGEGNVASSDGTAGGDDDDNRDNQQASDGFLEDDISTLFD